MLIKEREKYKTTALFKCDECGVEWMGNYYVLIKKDKHRCPNCSLRNGWKEKNKKKKTYIQENLKKYIIKRIDGNSLDYLPKRKDLKIIIKCSECGETRQSNSFDVLDKNSTLCNRCVLKKVMKYADFSFKKDPKYRKKLSETMKKSKAWKETNHLRIKGLKNYWKEKRGGKNLEEIHTEWELYKKLAYKIMEKNYRKHKKIINPGNLQRGKNKYHIDHKFSVLEGFKNNILPSIISHPFNLCMMYYKDNLSKDYKCSITKKELLEGVL